MICHTTELMHVCGENVQGLGSSKASLSYLWLKYPNVAWHPLVREQLVHGRAQPGVHQCQGMGTAGGLGFEHCLGALAAT